MIWWWVHRHHHHIMMIYCCHHNINIIIWWRHCHHIMILILWWQYCNMIAIAPQNTVRATEHRKRTAGFASCGQRRANPAACLSFWFALDCLTNHFQSIQRDIWCSRTTATSFLPYCQFCTQGRRLPLLVFFMWKEIDMWLDVPTKLLQHQDQDMMFPLDLEPLAFQTVKPIMWQ